MAKVPPYIPPTYQKTLARLQQGELVRVPCADLEFSTYAAGAGSVAVSRNSYSNGDHTGIGYNLQTGGSGLGTNIASLAAVINGRTVGIRWRKLTTTPAFSLVIDGVAYQIPVQTRAAYFDNVQPGGLGAHKEGVFVVNDLPDGPHSVRVILHPDASAAKTLMFYGFIAERIAGYESPQPLDNFYGGGTLTNANVAVPTTDNASNTNHGVKAVIYYNTDASSHTVTISWNSVVITTLTIAAGATARFDLTANGVLLGASPNLVHKADANSVVTFICIGSM